MKPVIANNRKEQNRFLKFRKQIYKNQGKFIDNNYFMLQEIFDEKLCFVKRVKIHAISIVDDNNEILCQGVVAYASQLPEYIQLCFFEALENQAEAVDMLLEETKKYGREYKCNRMVIGLYGHVNYGLGFLNNKYDKINSFSAPGNEEYYNDYFRAYGFEEILLNSYYIEKLDDRLKRYSALLNKIYKNYEFRTFDKSRFDYYAKIYTDLNNECFVDHRYYYHREYEDDKEMLKELFLFMKEDSLIFAFKDNQPVGFVLWYPDYNELAKPGEAFGAKHYVKNLFKNKSIKAAKCMEFGVIEGHRKVGIPLALLDSIFKILPKYGCDSAITSWILDENKDSNSVCAGVCDGKDKEYVVYEQAID